MRQCSSDRQQSNYGEFDQGLTYVTPVVTTALAGLKTGHTLHNGDHDFLLVDIRIAGFEKKDLNVGILGKTVGNCQTAGTTTNDNVVKGSRRWEWLIQAPSNRLRGEEAGKGLHHAC